MPVSTNLWKDKVVYALVTAPKNGKGSRCLFLCTADPGSISYLPLAWYGLRWNIEVSYYERKTFWSMEEYRIRSREGIERLVHLISLSYSAMTLLPYSDEIISVSVRQHPGNPVRNQPADPGRYNFMQFREISRNCIKLFHPDKGCGRLHLIRF